MEILKEVANAAGLFTLAVILMVAIFRKVTGWKGPVHLLSVQMVQVGGENAGPAGWIHLIEGDAMSISDSSEKEVVELRLMSRHRLEVYVITDEATEEDRAALEEGRKAFARKLPK